VSLELFATMRLSISLSWYMKQRHITEERNPRCYINLIGVKYQVFSSRFYRASYKCTHFF